MTLSREGSEGEGSSGKRLSESQGRCSKGQGGERQQKGPVGDTSCASRITGPPTAALSLQTSDDVLTGDLPLAPRSEAPARWVRGMSSVSETLGLHPSFQETHPTLTIWRQFFSESLLGHVRSDADLIGPSSPEPVTRSLCPQDV